LVKEDKDIEKMKIIHIIEQIIDQVLSYKSKINIYIYIIKYIWIPFLDIIPVELKK